MSLKFIWKNILAQMKLFIHLILWRDICDKIWTEMKGDMKHRKLDSWREKESSKMLHFKGLAKQTPGPTLEKWSRKSKYFSVIGRKKMVTIQWKVFA